MPVRTPRDATPPRRRARWVGRPCAAARASRPAMRPATDGRSPGSRIERGPSAFPGCPSGLATGCFPLTVAGAAAALGQAPHRIPFSPSEWKDHQCYLGHNAGHSKAAQQDNRVNGPASRCPQQRKISTRSSPRSKATEKASNALRARRIGATRWFSVALLLGELREKPCFRALHTGAGSFTRLPWEFRCPSVPHPSA
jgi:hypothetical protein